MLNEKQIQRLVQKVSRLDEVYRPFLVQQCCPQQVYLNNKPVKEGLHWGKDFAVANFSFVAQNVPQGEVYLWAETGATETLVSHNGVKVGLIDAVEHPFAANERIHKYLLLPNLKEGDLVHLEAYFSHTFVGTMPYDSPSTYSLDGLYPKRPFQHVSLVTLYPQLQKFCQNLNLFNKQYAVADQFVKAQMRNVYQQLFQVLPLCKQRPSLQCLQQANDMLQRFFAEEKQKPFVGIIGHSHLDTAWLWTVEETKRKLLRTLSNAVTLLERYPEYKFFLSTVLYLQWVEQSDGNLFQRVKRLVESGQLEVNGATWVECDGNLTGAEAFCRQFLRGQRYLQQKFGRTADVFWLPDTFGYSAALPQIMKKSGVEFFLTTKISWNDTNRFPYDTFVWQGLDGSRVTVHFNTIHCWVDEQSVSQRLNDLSDKRTGCALIAYGFGDGGGGPSEDMVQQALHTQNYCKVANVSHCTVSQFMNVASSRPLPTHFGELYLELHRGTYTTNHSLKQLNRRLEEALHNAELISVACGDKKAKLLTDKLYDVLMINQFHDILPGTCINQVNDLAISQLKDSLQQAQRYVLGRGKCKRYFNTLPFARCQWLPDQEGQSYVDLFGNKRTLSQFTFSPFAFGKRTSQGGEVFFDGVNVVTDCLRAKVERGTLTSLVFDGKETVKSPFNTLKVCEDVPYIYDNWDIDSDYTLKQQDVTFVDQQVVCSGPLLILRVRYKVTEKSTLFCDVKFQNGVAMVEFENRLVFGDTHTLLRTYFDTTIFATTYRCETQFGFVERNNLPQHVTDSAKFEVCSHKWTDLSQHDVGISLLSDSKYGVSCLEGKLGLTLHKSGTHPDSRGDVGESTFRYAILLHKGNDLQQTVQQAYCFNNLPVQTTRKNVSLPFTVSGNVIIETVKWGEEQGVVLRMYEYLGGDGHATVTAEGKSFALCSITEQSYTDIGSNQVQLHFTPFEIKTLQIK